LPLKTSVHHFISLKLELRTMNWRGCMMYHSFWELRIKRASIVQGIT